MSCHACGGHGDAAVDALNAIAVLCGCPNWDYAGQVVRDVKAMRDRQVELEMELFKRTLPSVLDDLPEQVDRAVRSAAGCDRAQPDDELLAFARAVWSCASMDTRPKTPAHAIWNAWMEAIELRRPPGPTTQQLAAMQLVRASVANCCAMWMMTPEIPLELLIMEQIGRVVELAKAGE